MRTKLTLRVLTMSIGLLCFMVSSGQVFQKLGNGINVSTSMYGKKSVIHNGNVYMSYFYYTNQGPVTVVERWDGLAWHQYPKLLGYQVSDIEIFQNNIYLSTSDYPTGANVFKFNGTTWSPLFSNLTGRVNDMTVYNSKLICVGPFTETTSSITHIMGYDGTSVSSFPPFTISDSLSSVSVINNELWVAGNIGGFNPQDTANIRKLQGGTSWVAPAIAHKPTKPFAWQATMVFDYNSKTYCIEDNNLYEIKNDTAHYIANTNARSVAENNGLLLMANGWSTMELFDGQNISSIVSSPYGCGGLVSDGNYAYGMFSDTMYINGQDYNHVFKMNGQFGLMSGKTYIDNNGNCTYDPATDELVPLMRMTSTSSNPVSFGSDRSGNYQVALIPGSYGFTQGAAYTSLNTYLIPDCNAGGTITISAGLNCSKRFCAKA